MRKSSTFRAIGLLAGLGATAWLNAPLLGQFDGQAGQPADVKPAPDEPKELCGTWEHWIAAHPNEGGIAGSCPLEGNCDDPAVRNSFIPNGGTPIKTIRLRFHVFANNDGSNPASSAAEVAAQVVKLNSDFAPWRVQFTQTNEIINNSTYRSFNPNTEEAAMKNAYAQSPATQLNIYVVHTECCYSGLGTFPWDANSLGNLGGIIIDDASFDGTNEVLTHEVGHCIGLWHTHHGVSEVGACTDCYELAGSNSDTTGDFCADTPPTPTNFNCAGPGGNDACSGNPWGPTQPQNYMGYGGPACWTQFTSQQAGRMHCWITARLQSWLVGPPPPCPGPDSCFASHASLGCNNSACCDAVCAQDPFCCATSWDSICVGEANTLCTGCGGAGVGSCYTAHGTPNCDNATCCSAVCAVDPFCCNNQWDSICVNEANSICASCGGAGAGDCYTIRNTPFCNTAACCSVVCGIDPFCCSNQWDSICVHEALDNCPVDVVAGPITNPANGNQYYLLGKASWPNAEAKAASLGGHLATVRDVAENDWIRANVANFGGTPREAWIGYNDTASEGAFTWVSGQPYTYTNWNGGEPNNVFDEDYTEFFPTTGLWNDINRWGNNDNFAIAEIEILGKCGDILAGDCYQPHGTPYCNDSSCCSIVCGLDGFCCSIQWDSVCANEALDNCVSVLAGPITNPDNGNQYYLLSQASWTAAEAKAISLGGHLVTVRDAAENAWVTANLGNFGGNARNAWIGFTDQAVEGAFVWASGQPYTFTNWNAGEPNNAGNEDYAYLIPASGKWNDVAKYAGGAVFGTAEIEILGKCGDILSGPCGSSHGTPYCSNQGCCNIVCGVDPFCCSVQWDGICANEALSMCSLCSLADIAPPGGGNHIINIDDLLAVINAWGPCPGCPADINGSGAVNIDDLLAVINSWGPCP